MICHSSSLTKPSYHFAIRQ